MTESERKLLIWCALLHLRATPLSGEEAETISGLIETLRNEDPKPTSS